MSGMRGRTVLVAVLGLMAAAPAWAEPSTPPELAPPPPVEPLPSSTPATPPPDGTGAVAPAPATVTSAKAAESAQSAFDVGTPMATPGERPAFYERAWFWTAIGVVAVTAVVILMSTSSQGPATPSTDLGSMRAF